jgi:peptidoglycan/LPS O-acetylase OafA/YrhL
MENLAAAVRRHRDNSFDLLRLVAATLVVVFHGWPLTGGADPTSDTTGITLGALGLLVFFAISGYLICGSWLREPVARRYAVKRALRIMPALLVGAFVVAFVLGPLVTSVSARDYFGDPGPYSYVGKQFFLDTFNTRLPGVFESNPYPDVVNGSLWTIPLEVSCYAALAIAGLLGILRRPEIMIAGLAVLFAAIVIGNPSISPEGQPGAGADAWLADLVPCVAFLVGALLWIYRDRIPRHPRLLAISLLPLVMWFLPSGLQIGLEMVTIPYAVIYLGSLRPGRLRTLIAPGDVSYGLYIYAYPTQQTIADAMPSIAPAAMVAIALPLAWTLGLLSWRVVESPALRLKARVAPGAIPPPDVEPGYSGR